MGGFGFRCLLFRSTQHQSYMRITNFFRLILLVRFPSAGACCLFLPFWLDLCGCTVSAVYVRCAWVLVRLDVTKVPPCCFFARVPLSLLLLLLSTARLRLCCLFFMFLRTRFSYLGCQIVLGVAQYRLSVFVGISSRINVVVRSALGWYLLCVVIFCLCRRPGFFGRLLLVLVFVLAIVVFAYSTGDHTTPIRASPYCICESCCFFLPVYRLCFFDVGKLFLPAVRSSLSNLWKSYVCGFISCTVFCGDDTTA